MEISSHDPYFQFEPLLPVITGRFAISGQGNIKPYEIQKYSEPSRNWGGFLFGGLAKLEAASGLRSDALIGVGVRASYPLPSTARQSVSQQPAKLLLVGSTPTLCSKFRKERLDMDARSGIVEIDAAVWTKDEYGCLNLFAHDADDEQVHCWLSLRPTYCDRGHIQLNIDGNLNLDFADSFPRFFFSFTEADQHTRTFLKWRLWKHRVHPHVLEVL